jgi:hypothetical protein
MKTRYSLVYLTLGLSLVLTAGLLWLMGGGLPVARAQGPDGIHTYYVDTGGTCGGQTPCYTTVQRAVDAVDDAGDVVKVAAGDYTGVNGYGGLPQVVYITRSLTLRGGYTTADWSVSDPRMYTTTLDAQGAGRALYIAGPAITVTVEGLHFTGGDASGLEGSDTYDAGGGVYVVQAVVTISSCVIYGNAASFSSVGVGGGVHFEGSQATLAGNTVAGNVACSGCGMGGSGGGVYVRNGGATLTGNTIIDNTADEGSYMGLGGGVTLDGYQVLAVTLSGNTIAGNTATTGIQGLGGGVFAFARVVTMTGNSIISNTAGITRSLGGGVHFEGGQAILISNTIAGNTAAFSSIAFGDGGGGGVCLRSSLSTLTGNTIANNRACSECPGQFSAVGGGLYLDRGSSILTGNTIIGNTAPGSGDFGGYGGGGYLEGGSFTLTGNTIVNNATFGKSTMGGGLCLFFNSSTLLTGNTVVGNSTGDGGGLGMFENGVFTLTNNLLADNSAYRGSALWLGAQGSEYHVGYLLHNTIANNTGAGSIQSGVYVGGNTTLYLTNTIIAGHAEPAIDVGPIGNNVSLVGTLWYSNTQDVAGAGAGSVVSGTNRYGDPAFVDPANGDYHIGTDSWALDGGIFAGTLTDSDGDARPTNPARPDAPDLGYDENVSLTVRRPVAADSVTFGAACARLAFTDTGSLSAITLTVEPGRFPTNNPADPVVSRTVTFTPSSGAPFSATLSLCYDDAEVKGGLNESDLQLYRWTGGGWQGYVSSVDTANDVVTALHVAALSPWVIGDRDRSPTVVRLRAAGIWSPFWFGAALALFGLASVLACALVTTQRRRQK